MSNVQFYFIFFSILLNLQFTLEGTKYDGQTVSLKLVGKAEILHLCFTGHKLRSNCSSSSSASSSTISCMSSNAKRKE